MNSRSISATHHIFFPPRLQVVGGEDDAEGLSADLRSDAAVHRLLGEECGGPPGSPWRGRPAHHRDDGSLLRAVQPPWRLRPSILRERCIQPSLEVALADAR